MTSRPPLNLKSRVASLVRFLLVGVLNTGFSYLIYAVLLFFGLGYQLANFLALVVGILFSFKTQGRLVFGNTDNRLLGRFIVSWTLIYIVNIGIINRLMVFGFDAYVAGALALPVSAMLSYLIQQYIVFRKSGKGSGLSERD